MSGNTLSSCLGIRAQTVILAFSGQRPRLPLNILQPVGQSHTTKNYSTQNDWQRLKKKIALHRQVCHLQVNFYFLFSNPRDFFFFCLVVLDKSPMLNKRGESRHIFLVIDFREKVLSLSLLTMILAVGFLQMDFIRLKTLLSISDLLEFFKEQMLHYVT